MSKDDIWAEEPDAKEFADAGDELEERRDEVRDIGDAAVQGFLTRGLVGMIQAVDRAEAAIRDEDVEDPEALRRAEEAVRTMDSPFSDRVNEPEPDAGMSPDATSHEVDPTITPYVPRSVVVPDTQASFAPVGVPGADPNLSDNARMERMAGGGVSTGKAIAIIVGFLVLMAVLYVLMRP
jgi:hypothetical protein